MLLVLFCHLEAVARTAVARTAAARTGAGRRPDDAGQASAEYALVLLGAAAVALLVLGWATKTDKIGHLLDSVVDRVQGSMSSKKS